MSFLDSLLEQGVIKRTEYEEIISDLETTGTDFDRVLAKHGLGAEELLELRSKYFGIPTKDVKGLAVPFDVLKNIPEESALYYKFAPLAVEDGVLEIGIVDPDNTAARDAIQFTSSKLNIPFKLTLISEEGFRFIVDQYKGLTGEVNKALTELESELIKDKPGVFDVGEEGKESTESKIIEKAPVTKIVAVILRHAVEGRASDIHVEHIGDRVRVRFRVDGTMYTSLLLPVNVHAGVVARIKILCNMKLDEKRKPQDGRFRAVISGKKIDFRVSTLPSYYGEKVVMRILDSDQQIRTLEQIGISPENVVRIREVIQKPYGLVLLTGPTGSGKTTTLYAMLNEIDRDGKNVVSLEDPVEYQIGGMSQSQVHPEIGYTFANGLRSILRQDPDIIMVGEIRDKETAQLAIQAALTGHLVLSTIHTNNASGVIPRLIDMGVDPYLIAPTLLVAIGQRLVKTACEDAKKQVPLEGPLRMIVDKEIADLPLERQKPFKDAKFVHEVVPSPTCPTGTRGRTGVYECLWFDKELEELVLKGAGEEEIYALARKKGMYTMKEDAILKAISGEIPFEQINELG